MADPVMQHTLPDGHPLAPSALDTVPGDFATKHAAGTPYVPTVAPQDDDPTMAKIVYAEQSTGGDPGTSAGTPGNAVLPFVVESGGTLVLGAHDSGVEELPCGRIRRNLTASSFLRGQADVAVAGAVTSYLDLAYSLDNGATLEADLIGLRVPLKTAQHSVGFAVPVPVGAQTDVLLVAVCAGGNGTDEPEIINFIVDATSAEPPPADGEDEPVDPEAPGDYPEGGALGSIIHRWHAGSLIGVVADGGAVSSLPDIAGFLPAGDGDGYPDGAVSQASPAFRLTGFDNGLPCIEMDGSNDGLTMNTQMTGGAFSMYALVKGLTTPAGNYGAVINGNAFPNGKGWLLQSDGQFNVYVDTSVPVPTNQIFADTWTKANTHLYRWVFNAVGDMWFYVDGVQKAHIFDSALTAGTLATKLRLGAYTGVFAIGMKLAELVTWNGVHSGATGDPVEAAILAAWGL